MSEEFKDPRIKIYLAKDFQMMEIQEILQGQDEGLDTSIYEDTRFDWKQMEEIRKGLKEHKDVKYYAMPQLSAQDMREKRLSLEPVDPEAKTQEKQNEMIRLTKSVLMGAGVVFIIAVFIGILFMFRDRVVLSVQDLSLELTQEEITLDFRQQFHASDYIESYTKGNSIELILPEDVDTSVLGSQSITYSLTNGVKTISKNLVINVVDQEPPVLKLKYSKVTLHDYDSFNGRMFIDSATDNCDGDLTDSVLFGELDHDLEKQKIHYSISDSSGNTAEADLMVIVGESIPEMDGETGEPEEPSEEPEELVIEQPEITAIPEEPVQEQPSESSQPQQYTQQEYDETVTYEENGGTTTCTIHHYADGSTSESCEWIGPWEVY